MSFLGRLKAPKGLAKALGALSGVVSAIPGIGPLASKAVSLVKRGVDGVGKVADKVTAGIGQFRAGETEGKAAASEHRSSSMPMLIAAAVAVVVGWFAMRKRSAASGYASRGPRGASRGRGMRRGYMRRGGF